MYEFEKVKGAVKPKEIDTDSSQYYTYIRKNIKPCKEVDETGETTFEGWEYDECKVINDEWVVDQMKENKESNDALLLGLCDLYETQIGGYNG